MRKAILTTAAIGLIAFGAAMGVTQSDNIKAWLTQSAEVYKNEMAATETAAVETPVDETTTDGSVTAEAAVEEAVVADATTDVTTDTTTDTAVAETSNATEINLDVAPAAGEEPKAEAAATTESEDEPELSDEAKALAGAPQPKAEVPVAETKYKFDVAAALRDREQGSIDAPVVVEDFSSLTCPHCAKFHNEIFDKIKQNYIDTGKVRWVYRSYPLNEPALRAEMLARCAPNDQYIALVDMMFKNQVRWAYSDDPMSNLSIMVRVAGIDDDIFLACVNNKELQSGLVQAAQANSTKYGLKATPTFVLNGGEKQFTGAGTYDGFAFDIEELLRKSKETKQSQIPDGKLQKAIEKEIQ